MKSVKERFNELVSLTQLFILREHSLKDKQTVNPDTLAFFKKRATSGAPLNPANAHKEFIPPPAPVSTSLPPQPSIPQIQPAPLPSPQPVIEPTLSTTTVKSTLPPQELQVQSPPPTQNSIPEKSVNKGIAHQPLGAPPTRDHGEFWKLFETRFPMVPTSEIIPSDTLARKIKNSWLAEQQIPPIIILSFNDQEEKHLLFLKNIAKAITVRIAPARVLSADKLEKERQWDDVLATPDLKLVIANDYGLYLHPELMRHYREMPQQGKHHLKHVPLLLLSDPTLYLQEPQLKLLLWRAICNEFNNTSQNPPSTG